MLPAAQLIKAPLFDFCDSEGQNSVFLLLNAQPLPNSGLTGIVGVNISSKRNIPKTAAVVLFVAWF